MGGMIARPVILALLMGAVFFVSVTDLAGDNVQPQQAAAEAVWTAAPQQHLS